MTYDEQAFCDEADRRWLDYKDAWFIKQQEKKQAIRNKIRKEENEK